MDFNKIEFLFSYGKAPFPSIKNDKGKILPEIAIVGRSNVGKSSLINHFFNQKIAKTSSQPGKTTTVNFFKIDDRLILVDLPGYGYAKRSKRDQTSFSQVVDDYLKTKNYKLILFLVDIRREPSEDDLKFYNWAASQNINLIVILTKCDKVKAFEQKKNTVKIIHILNKINSKIMLSFINYSIKETTGKTALSSQLKHFLFDNSPRDVQ